MTKKYTIELDDYRLVNLQEAFKLLKKIANTGDWCFEIANELDAFGTPENFKPNSSFEEQLRSCKNIFNYGLVHVDLNQYENPLENDIDWSYVSEEIKAYISSEYKRGYYDAQRRLAEDLSISMSKLLPCPKCKSEDITPWHTEYCWVECNYCGYESKCFSEILGDKFKEHWNNLKRK